MRKFNITLFLFFAVSMSFAQNSNLVLFSEGGERFYLVLNGIQHNENPETNVKITGLNAAPYKAKVVFEDPKIGSIDKTLYTTENAESTYSIRFQGDSKAGKGAKKLGNSMIKTIGNTDTYKEKPKVYKIKLVSQVDIPAKSTNATPTNNTTNSNQSTTTSTTTTTTNTNVNSGTTPNNASISMNVSINDGMTDDNANVRMNVSDNTTYSESTTTTTNTTTGGESYGNSTVSHRCDYPMDDSDFLDGKRSIESKTFADSKMTVAKQITKANCPTAAQIRDYTKLFTFESGKVEYAKFAYDYCYDKGNYYKVNDAFEFESSIDDLNDHIEGK